MPSTNSPIFVFMASHKPVAHSAKVSLKATKTTPTIAAKPRYFVSDFNILFFEKDSLSFLTRLTPGIKVGFFLSPLPTSTSNFLARSPSLRN